MDNELSPLTRGAWIEIRRPYWYRTNHLSPLTRGAWIEIGCYNVASANYVSPLTRGAWIEMRVAMLRKTARRRPSHEGRGLKSEQNRKEA